VSMKFWIWDGDVPSGPEQAISSTGVVINPTESFYEILAPAKTMSEFRTAQAAEELAATYFVFYISPAGGGQWMLANCWGHFFDSVDALLTSEEGEVANETWRTVRESFPNFGTLMDRNKEPMSTDLRLLPAEDPFDSETKWMLTSFLALGEINSYDELLERSVDDTFNLLEASFELLTEAKALEAMPNLAQHVGSERIRGDRVAPDLVSLDHAIQLGRLRAGR
jgi:hypothetical protein